MYRSKRLMILLAVLVVVCVAAGAALGWEQRQEQIKTSGSVVLEIPADDVQALSWTREGETLSFTRGEGGDWSYDADQAFPVDGEVMDEMLAPFTAFSAAFIIEQVDDESQYGLDDPVCTISIATGEESWEIRLGDTSTVDGQRYVSLGDGNVYLAVSDPLDQYETTLRDCIRNDRVPDLDQAAALGFSGSENYEIFRQEDNSAYTYCAEDVYFTEQDGSILPLDTGNVEAYLSTLTALDLTDYVTYDVSDEELAQYGLEDPELTVTVSYPGEDGVEGTFLLQIGRDPSQADDDEETVTAYVRVGDSSIVYRITSQEYTDLLAASVDELRHQEVFTADFAAVQSIDISLEGQSHTLTAQEDGTWTYQEHQIDIETLQTALESLRAQEFTQEQPRQQLEISLTIHLDHDTFPQIEMAFYRWDGESCLAVVDGTPVCTVDRAAVVDLVEAVQAIVLRDYTQEE